MGGQWFKTDFWRSVDRRGQDAELLNIRALAITEAALGKEHPDIGTCLNNLANVLPILGKSESENLWRRSLELHPTG